MKYSAACARTSCGCCLRTVTTKSCINFCSPSGIGISGLLSPIDKPAIQTAHSKKVIFTLFVSRKSAEKELIQIAYKRKNNLENLQTFLFSWKTVITKNHKNPLNNSLFFKKNRKLQNKPPLLGSGFKFALNFQNFFIHTYYSLILRIRKSHYDWLIWYKIRLTRSLFCTIFDFRNFKISRSQQE